VEAFCRQYPRGMTLEFSRPESDRAARKVVNSRPGFHKEDFSGFELTTVQLGGQRPKWIRGCRFVGSDLRTASLDGSYFSGCDFGKADMRNISARRASFTNCRFVSADLRAADLSECRFQDQNTGDDTGGCDLTGAELEGAILRAARFDARARWPLGFDPVQAGATSTGS
jgi:uncharacterized protein YjbI with pentapeptide repeats